MIAGRNLAQQAKGPPPARPDYRDTRYTLSGGMRIHSSSPS